MVGYLEVNLKRIPDIAVIWFERHPLRMIRLVLANVLLGSQEIYGSPASHAGENRTEGREHRTTLGQ